MSARTLLGPPTGRSPAPPPGPGQNAPDPLRGLCTPNIFWGLDTKCWGHFPGPSEDPEPGVAVIMEGYLGRDPQKPGAGDKIPSAPPTPILSSLHMECNG